MRLWSSIPPRTARTRAISRIKTDPDGKAIIDVIPTGSLVRVQIIANGFATLLKTTLSLRLVGR